MFFCCQKFWENAVLIMVLFNQSEWGVKVLLWSSVCLSAWVIHVTSPFCRRKREDEEEEEEAEEEESYNKLTECQIV